MADDDGLVNELDRIDHLFGRSEDRELLNVASLRWPDHGHEFEPAHAEIARYARVSAYRYRRDETAIWQERAIEAGVGSGNTASLALSLQFYFFRAIDEGRVADAHRVLDVMEGIASLPTNGARPAPDLVRRIIAERRRSRFEWRASGPRQSPCTRKP